jgi:hypothetical protein
MTEAIVIRGSDPRLKSEFEVRRDDALHFRVPADGERIALYGPYIPLSPGEFRLELMFAITDRTPGKVTIELCHKQAEVKFYVRRCFSWELDAGLIRISYPFKTDVDDLEVRLIVPASFAGSIQQLSILATE